MNRAFTREGFAIACLLGRMEIFTPILKCKAIIKQLECYHISRVVKHPKM